jgi:hypothetical protein
VGEVLAEQTVRDLVAAPPPGTARIAEVDRDTGVDGEPDVLGHLVAAVPGERPTELLGEGEDPPSSPAISFVNTHARRVPTVVIVIVSLCRETDKVNDQLGLTDSRTNDIAQRRR